jgi:hypothetical protein
LPTDTEGVFAFLISVMRFIMRTGMPHHGSTQHSMTRDLRPKFAGASSPISAFWVCRSRQVGAARRQERRSRRNFSRNRPEATSLNHQ